MPDQISSKLLGVRVSGKIELNILNKHMMRLCYHSAHVKCDLGPISAPVILKFERASMDRTMRRSRHSAAKYPSDQVISSSSLSRNQAPLR